MFKHLTCTCYSNSRSCPSLRTRILLRILPFAAAAACQLTLPRLVRDSHQYLPTPMKTKARSLSPDLEYSFWSCSFLPPRNEEQMAINSRICSRTEPQRCIHSRICPRTGTAKENTLMDLSAYWNRKGAYTHGSDRGLEQQKSIHSLICPHTGTAKEHTLTDLSTDWNHK
jgi:hypothetical protein